MVNYCDSSIIGECNCRIRCTCSTNRSSSLRNGEEMILSGWTKLGYGVGHVLNDLCSSLWFTYGLIFYNKVVVLNGISSGGLILVGQIADAIATPLVGIASDRQLFRNKYGKRKSWHLIGTIGVVLTLPFMFSPCIACSSDTTESIKMAYYSIFIIIFQWSWAFVQISHLSLAPDLTLCENERTSLLSLRTTFAVLSNISVYSTTWAILADFSSGSNVINSGDMEEFQILSYSVCVAGTLATIIFHLLVQEKPADETLLGSSVCTRNSYKSIFKQFSLYQVAVLYLTARLYGNMIQTLIPFYVHDVLQLSAEHIAAVPFVMYISSFLTSFITGPLNKYLGRKVSYLFGGVIAAGGILGIAFGKNEIYKEYLIYLVAIFLGSAQCTFLVTGLGIISDLIGDDTGNGAFIYGVMSFTDKLSSGAAIMAVQALKPASDDTQYYQYATVIVCGVSAVVGTLATLTLRLPNREPSQPDNSSSAEDLPA